MSSRLEGFDIMDMSTSLLHDPKLRRLSREQPTVLAPAFMAYVATVAESWKAGDRVSVDDAWPSYLPYDEAAVTALVGVRLLDDGRRVPVKAWRGWFAPARKRRESARKRWSDWKARQSGKRPDLNGNAHGEQTSDQPLANVGPTGNRPSVRTNKKKYSPTARTEKKNRPTNGQAKTDPPTSGRTHYDDHLVSDDSPNAWSDTTDDDKPSAGSAP
jgi:hypothetical protein